MLEKTETVTSRAIIYDRYTARVALARKSVAAAKEGVVTAKMGVEIAGPIEIFIQH